MDLPPVDAIVDVTVGISGKPTDFTVSKSSGYADIDQATLRAARWSTYSPKMVDCNPVVGTYPFRAEFFPSETLKFVIAPAFLPPTGWERSASPTSPASFKELGEWNWDGDFIGVMGAFTHVSLEQFVQDKTQQITGSDATVLASAPLSLCGGTVNGWQITYQQGATHYREVIQVMDLRLYDAYYYGPDAPSSMTIASLDSLCGK